MSGNKTSNTEALIRSELWADEIEEILHEMLLAVNITRTVDFPDGTELTFPSIGTPTVRSRGDGAPFAYDALDTGEFSLYLRDEVYSSNSISKKLRQDSRWINEVGAQMPSLQAIAIMERYESDLLALANHQFDGQNTDNAINGTPHRWVAKGANQTMSLADFALVPYVMKKSKMSTNGLVGIVDPSVGNALDNLQNIVNVSNNPRFEGIVETGISPNMRFVKSVYGVDVYESNLLVAANETINAAGAGARTTTNGVANIFTNVSNAALLPFMNAWKEQPTTKSEIDFDTDDLKTVTTARWGNGMAKDENLIVVLSDTDQVIF